jgi:hypothetical protein
MPSVPQNIALRPVAISAAPRTNFSSRRSGAQIGKIKDGFVLVRWSNSRAMILPLV